MSEERKTQRLSILISDSMYSRLSEVAEKYDQSMSAFVQKAIEREFERKEEEELEQVAADLSSLYETEEEHTVFTELDRETFSET